MKKIRNVIAIVGLMLVNVFATSCTKEVEVITEKIVYIEEEKEESPYLDGRFNVDFFDDHPSVTIDSKIVDFYEGDAEFLITIQLPLNQNRKWITEKLNSITASSEFSDVVMLECNTVGNIYTLEARIELTNAKKDKIRSISFSLIDAVLFVG